MIEPNREDNFHDDLMALADGELDAERALVVLRELARRPDAMQWFENQQRIKIAAKRALSTKAPSDLRDRIAALGDVSHDVPADENAASAPIRPAGWTRAFAYLSAAAAGLLIGVFAATNYRQSPSPINPNPPRDVAQHISPVSATTIADASRIHANCSRLAEALHNASLEKTDASLAAEVRADLQGEHPVPDLTPIGFHYTGAGPCTPVMIGTIHLLYHSSRPRSVETVSIFVQENHGQLPGLDTSNIYAVSSDTSPFPMLAWETDRVIYFLITDDLATQQRVIGLLRPKASTQPIAAPAK